MHVVHVTPGWKLPVRGYGGSERVVFWLAKAQARAGLRVSILAAPGSHCPGVRVVPVRGARDLASRLPPDADVFHLHGVGEVRSAVPFLVTVQGNSPEELAYRPEKVYVSRDHARRAGAVAFVYNGVDPEEYVYCEKKGDYFLFLARASRPVKGLDTALRLARRAGIRLVVAGGTRWALRRTGGWLDSLRARVHFCGTVDGLRKARLLAEARALLFPIRWPEPFGIVVAEALVSGTPVVTVPLGAMPEIVAPDVGFLCESEDEMLEAIRRVDEVSPAACRRRALSLFTSELSAEKYRRYYERLLATGTLDGAEGS